MPGIANAYTAYPVLYLQVCPTLPEAPCTHVPADGGDAAAHLLYHLPALPPLSFDGDRAAWLAYCAQHALWCAEAVWDMHNTTIMHAGLVTAPNAELEHNGE